MHRASHRALRGLWTSESTPRNHCDATSIAGPDRGVQVLQWSALVTPSTDTRRAVSILARSLFRQMREQGYTPEQIIGLSSELITLVSDDLRQERASDARWAAE